LSSHLKDQVAIVTGAGRGFGKAIATRLAAEGAAVTLTSRNKTELDGVVREIEAKGGRALAAAGDVTKPIDVETVVRTAERQFGPTTLLINNDGLSSPYGPIGMVDTNTWWQAISVHVLAPFLYFSALMPGMRERKSGRLITIASLGGHTITKHLSAYCVGKGAQIKLAQEAAVEGKEFGISSFAIEPGTVMTPMAYDTINAPDAQKWFPGGVAFLKELARTNPDPEPGYKICTDMCVKLASGKYDELSGWYIEPKDDFDALLARARGGEKPYHGGPGD
jgi:NAD(P)-dependent dehydrogenase (short-subunit alcohol dehydrogenase family)